MNSVKKILYNDTVDKKMDFDSKTLQGAHLRAARKPPSPDIAELLNEGISLGGTSKSFALPEIVVNEVVHRRMHAAPSSNSIYVLNKIQSIVPRNDSGTATILTPGPPDAACCEESVRQVDPVKLFVGECDRVGDQDGPFVLAPNPERFQLTQNQLSLWTNAHQSGHWAYYMLPRELSIRGAS